MSYRELRDFTEILRSLRFPRLVSIENFRCPNFALMAEILEWIATKFDANVRIPKCIDNETDRVIFVKTCVMFLIQKAHVRLNPKNLYQSDGLAVKELLTILRMLYASRQYRNGNKLLNNAISEIRLKVNSVRQGLVHLVQLGAQFPHSAANIYNFLNNEIVAKEERRRAISQILNANEVERELNEMMAQIEERTVDLRHRLANISTDEQELERKIERRKRECEQLQKRFAKLQNFRPPYMDEYERYEVQLKELYAVYVIVFRNLAYMQQQLSDVERTERERMINAEHNMRLAVDKMRLENEMAVPSIIGNTNLNGDGFPHAKEMKVIGNMLGVGLSDDDEDDDDGDDGDNDIDDDVDGDKNVDETDIFESNKEIKNKPTEINTHIYNKHFNVSNMNDILSDGDDTAHIRGLEAIIEHEDEEDFRDTDDDF